MKKLKKFNKELSSIKYGWYDKEGKLHESLIFKYSRSLIL